MTGIYLDHNATTPMLPAVWEAMRPFFFARPGNPASSHFAGRQARQALEDSRERVASLLEAHADEVIFTSGATEANNLAVFGLCTDRAHVVCSPIEHPCVTEPVRRLAEGDCAVDWLSVDAGGIVAPESLAAHLRPGTGLVCVMLANHETGAVQPIERLASALPEGVNFHCDAAAAAGKMPISFRRLGIATLTISGHKFHGPKGIGVLVLRKGTKLRPMLFGGHQQQGRRPGTEPVALAVGLATALELACQEMEQRQTVVLQLRRRFLDVIRRDAAPVVLNGLEEGGIPHTLNLSFPGCRADVLLMNLDLAGVACSTGSACSSGSLLPSPVLRAMHVAEDVLHSAMRFSFSQLLTEADVAEAARRITDVVRRLRTEQPHTS